MLKNISTNPLLFLIILVCLGLLGAPASETAASSGANVFRGSVSPSPVAQPAPKNEDAAVKSEPAPQVKKNAPQAATSKSGSAGKSTAQTTKKSESVKKKQAETPKKVTSQVKAKKKTESKKATSQAKAKKKTEAKKAASQVKAKKQAAVVKKAAVTSGKTGPAKKSAAISAGAKKDLHLNVKAAILINMSNGKVYFEQNADKTIAPASITKLLTLYLVREAMAQGRISSKTSIPISDRAVRTGGSRMSLKRGEKVPLNELIQGISVVSANNACVAVAEYMGKGDPNKFVAQMNAKAKKIGMKSSAFKNPNGLPAEGQLSTARDIARLSMSYLRTFPDSLKVHSMTAHTYHGTTRRNANSLLRTYKGVDGLKTGFVCASGYNISVTAKRGNTRLVAVVLGAQNSSIRHVEATRLLDYGFKKAAQDAGVANRDSTKPAQKPKA